MKENPSGYLVQTLFCKKHYKYDSVEVDHNNVDVKIIYYTKLLGNNKATMTFYDANKYYCTIKSNLFPKTTKTTLYWLLNLISIPVTSDHDQSFKDFNNYDLVLNTRKSKPNVEE